MDELIEPPAGCMEIPGFIMIVKGGGWLTKDGKVTENFEERGVWETPEDAEMAMGIFTD